MTPTSARYYESEVGSETTTVVRVDGDQVQQRTEMLSRAGGYSDHVVFWTDLRCDAEGAFVLAEEYESTTTYDDGRIDTSWGNAVYDPPGLLMPAGAADGTTWTTELASTDTTDSGQVSHYSATFDNSLTVHEDVTVPAGTFPALAWTQTMGEATGTLYVAAGPGLLADGELLLAAYTP